MRQTVLAWLSRLIPFGRLTVTCHYPTEETLVFHHWFGRRFLIASRPNQIFSLVGVSVSPEVPGLGRFISDGAIAGAGAAAFLDWDIMEGAIIGNWIDRSRQTRHPVHQLRLVFVEQTSQEQVQFELSLSEQDCKTVYRYFVGSQ